MNLALALSLAFSPTGPVADDPAPLPPLPSARQLAWHEREFYAFVHFNMNTFTGAEWGTGQEDPSLFAPTELDCRQWARVASEAGMTGIILTAKHHDGFCLWPSAYTEHDVAQSAWRGGKGDVLADLSAACREYGLGFGVYLSPWDRNHPTYGDSDAYNAVFAGQLREVLTGYGDVFEVWFDGACGEGPNGKRQEYDWDLFHDTVRELQPEAVIFHGGRPDLRWVGNERGFAGETCWYLYRGDEYGVGESERPAELNVGHADGTHWIPAECDVSIRPGWYYHAEQDGAVKSLDELEGIWDASVGRGANLLLNLPVDRRGLVHENDAARLAELARLLRATYDDDLCAGATGRASNVRGGDERFGAAAALDGDPATYWATDDEVRTAFLDVELDGPRVLDRVVLAEPIALGQRIARFHVEARIDGRWTEVARGTTVGRKRILALEPVVATGLRIVVEDARGCPLLASVAAFASPPRVAIEAEETVFLGETHVRLRCDQPEAIVRYTLDGSEPGEGSAVYSGPLTIRRDARLVARADAPGNPGLATTRASFRAYTKETLREPVHTFVAPQPGWRVRAYEGGWQTLDQLADARPASESIVPVIGLEPRPRDEHFALVFEGLVQAPEDGIFTFFLASDDGSRLYVGDELLIENDGLHGRLERAGAIGLKAGWHPVRVEYFNAGGGRDLELAWRGPKVSKQALPAERCAHL